MSDQEVVELLRTLQLGELALKMAENHIANLERQVRDLQKLVDEFNARTN